MGRSNPSALGIAAAAALLAVCLAPPAQAQFGRSCANLGDTLINGACSEFVAYVQRSNEYYYTRSNAELQAYMRQTPSPTAQCCSDSVAFVGQGCSCNNIFVNYVAANRGFSARTLAVVARAVELSNCAASYSIVNPCDSQTQQQQQAPAQPRLITAP